MRTKKTTSTRFNLKFFGVLSKHIQPGRLHCTIFTWKISAVIFIGEGFALSRLQNDYNLITYSIHYYILANTRSRMTTAITFSRQNDIGSRKSTTQ